MEHSKESFFKKIKKIPLSIPLLTTLICIYGFILLYSAAGGNITPWASKQIAVFSIFLPLSLKWACLNHKKNLLLVKTKV